jgi:hypothetical protein
MRRWIALTSAVLITPALATAASATAQATPVDPADALRRQFQTDHGVKITEIVHISDVPLNIEGYKPEVARLQSDGELQFGPSGPVASDVTVRESANPTRKKRLEALAADKPMAVPPGRFNPYRVIGDKTSFYSGVYADWLPEGKTWVRQAKRPGDTVSPEVRFFSMDQRLSALEPTVLRALVNSPTATHSGDGLRHWGTITTPKLHKIRGTSPSEPFGRTGGEISWRLWLDGSGLPKRLTTTQYEGGLLPHSAQILKTDTRYSAWGTPVSITAPWSNQVIDEEDLPDSPPTFKILVNATTTRPDGH